MRVIWIKERTEVVGHRSVDFGHVLFEHLGTEIRCGRLVTRDEAEQVGEICAAEVEERAA